MVIQTLSRIVALNAINGLRMPTLIMFLMNPPYNAQQKHCNEAYVSSWKATGSSKKKPTEDPSKGFHFVYEIAKQMSGGGGGEKKN